ncbi:DsrE family protein [Robertkochia sediminum]|uniref:DsrE family protein n=1 Tax=Robertkochia sediminum TaxID=2785326 RepID=UPI0019334611|nr:DsrE family protein [Robertkochia sediminum]MBL7473802.1 DsrE family protein [Robertkochia sediminum]
MSRYISVIIALFLTVTLWSQDQAVKVVFDVTGGSAKVQEAAARHADMMSQYYPNSQFEVVIYGGASDMALKEKSTVSDRIAAMAARDNVHVYLCQGTMKRKGIKEEMLLPGIETVPDAIMELALKQQQGWSYIKEGN